MPVPIAPQLAGFVQANDLPPANRTQFSQVLGEIVYRAYDEFARTAHVLPGVPTTATPPANAGATAGPGKLMAVPTPAPVLLQNVSQKTKSLALDDGQRSTLDKMLAEGLALSLQALAGATMLPGVPIAGNLTTAPGKLMAPLVPALQAQVEQKLQSLAPGHHIPAAPVFNAPPGQKSDCLPKEPAKVIAVLIGKSAQLFVDQVMVAPGIPCAPGVTAGPGRLV